MAPRVERQNAEKGKDAKRRSHGFSPFFPSICLSIADEGHWTVDHFVVWGETHLRRMLRTSLLQRHQNALVAGQRCTGLSSDSAYRTHQLTRDPWRTSSPLCPDLGFRYTHRGRKPRTIQKMQRPKPNSANGGRTASIQAVLASFNSA